MIDRFKKKLVRKHSKKFMLLSNGCIRYRKERSWFGGGHYRCTDRCPIQVVAPWFARRWYAGNSSKLLGLSPRDTSVIIATADNNRAHESFDPELRAWMEDILLA